MLDNINKWKNKQLGISKPVRHIFLKDGTPIHSIQDIPLDEVYIFVSPSPIFKGFRNAIRSKSQMVNRINSNTQESSVDSNAYAQGKRNSSRVLTKMKTKHDKSQFSLVSFMF